MNPAAHDFSAPEGPLRAFVAMFVAATLVVAGCASQTTQSINRGQPAESQVPYRLPPGTKVALTEGRFNRPITIVHGARGSPYPKGSYRPDSGPADWCGAALQTVLTLPLAAFYLAGCTQKVFSSGKPAKPVEVKQQPKRLTIVRDVPTEDASKERKASEGKSDSAPSSPQRQLAKRAFATAMPPLRSLPDRVRSIARERGLGELDEPPGQAMESRLDIRKAREVPDYVIEMGIAGVEIRPEHDEEHHYWFSVIGGGRLIRVADDSIVQAFTTEANTNAFPWTPEDVKWLSNELDLVINALAQLIVDEWLEPVLKGQR